MGKSRRALGRGLDVLIPQAEPGAVRELALDAIVPNPQQPRQRFDQERLDELAASLREHGILQPLVVSGPDVDGRYHLIIGERRWQAARLAGLERVPVVVREAADAAALEMALVENLQRQDLDPLEEAGAFSRLIDGFGLTQDAVAARVGRSRSAIANSLRLLALPGAAKAALAAGEITEGHARALLGVTDPILHNEILRRVLHESLNVRQTEELVRRASKGQPRSRRSARGTPPELQEVEEGLRAALGTKVMISKGRKVGRIVIEFYSDDDLQTLYDRFTR